jgi:hypothetical protein
VANSFSNELPPVQRVEDFCTSRSSGSEAIEDAEATNVWFVRIGEDIERSFFEACGGEG